MGPVFLGRSPGGRHVAVKVVHAQLAQDPDLGGVTAPVVDADPDATTPWLATTYVPGLSLHQAVTGNGPMPPASVLALAAALAESLAAIHAAGVVHRDRRGPGSPGPRRPAFTPEHPGPASTRQRGRCYDRNRIDRRDDVESIAVTTAAICAVLATMAGGARWAHQRFPKLEQAVGLVEVRSQQLVSDHGFSRRDDVAAIRKTVEGQSIAITEPQARLAPLGSSQQDQP